MKKLLLVFFLGLCSLIFAVPIQDHVINPAALSSLATALGIDEKSNIVEETQKHWLRKPNQERWEMAELSQDQKIFVLNWANAEGIFSQWNPSCRSYDKVLILGASTPRMKTRLEFIKNLWTEGVRFNEIVWLTGDRPLDKRIDDCLDRCSNESEAAHIIWEETDLPIEMRNITITFIAVPMKVDGMQIKRPNTEDTIIAWLKASPTPCKALFISDQPFCGYQFSIVKALLPKDFLFDVAGKGVDSIDHPAAAAITLDSIARWIYQEDKIAKAQ